MSKHARLLPVLLAPPVLLAFAAVSSPGKGVEVPLAAAEVFIEFNSTDLDFGIQFFWDGDPWTRMTIEDPAGKTVLRVKAGSGVAKQGLTEGFFESAEPPTAQLSMAQFLARFPAGEYEFEGKGQAGEELTGSTMFTHVLPAPPTNLAPAGITVNAAGPVVASFDAVTQDLAGNPLTPELYEIIVAAETGFPRVMTVVLDGGVASPSITIPPEFLTSGTEYKLEVIVQEQSGNRTIAEVTFCTS